MKKFILFTFLIILLVLGFSQKQYTSSSALLTSYQSAIKILQEAENQSEQAGDDELLQEKADKVFTKAYNSFNNIIPAAENNGYDSLLFFLKLKTAYISFYLNDQHTAKSAYLNAFTLKPHLIAIEDSFLFLPYVYTGGIYYNNNQFDSAVYYYKQAERIIDKYQKPLDGSQRIYNRLGAIYYETGNYRQAKNYFTKAITSLNTNNSMYAGFLGNYQINIAAIQIKLEEFEEAKKMYENILSSDTYNGTYNNEIYHNLGIISLREKKFGEALRFFTKVNYSNSKKNIELLYNIGMTWSGLNNSDSTNHYLSKALDENSKWFGNGKSISKGLIVKYKADIANKKKDYKTALKYYQQALIQFDNSFNETDSSKNPEQFNSVFSYFNLFNTLAAKADLFENIYGHEKKIIYLLNALTTYKTAFKLADFVEKTYDSDEARLFLGKIKYTVHSRPIDISLHLYELTKDKKYLEAAWNFDQRNKASLLSLNLQENEWKEKLTDSNELLQQEASLKKSITRTLLKIQNNTDSTQLPELYNYNRDKEIELGKVQDKINTSPEMKSISQLKRIPGISALQQQMDGSSAIISYHLSDTKILIFCLTAGSINYAHTVLNKELNNNIIQFRTALQNTNAGEKYQGADAAKYLFQQLLHPVIAQLPGITNLIIIPDDELHYLPFDALQDENDQYLLENFSIQYLYSASLFQKSNEPINYSSILGFAPFASKGKNDSNGIDLKRLTYSKEEIEQQNGKFFFDASASKKNFLEYANKYSVIHLATHAAVNNIEPNRSYIAFYPDSSDYLLYAPEIYNLDLDSTQLVILSACETGTGQLVKGEGLMSLSRAFSYAGCSNIIASLWNAEDKTTSFITKQLYSYLIKGYSKTKALQKAKLDLLNDKNISPSLKSPNYWSHLVFIGDYEANTKSTIPIWLIMSVCLFIAGILLILQQKNRKT